MRTNVNISTQQFPHFKINCKNLLSEIYNKKYLNECC